MSLSTEDVWQDMSQKLRLFFYRRLGDVDLAEDLLQETFIRIHNGLASLHEHERLAAWVYRIAYHTWIDYVRKEQAARPPLVTPQELRSDAPATNYNEVVGDWLRQMVQNLPASYRTAVALAELDGMTQREVSVRLGLSLSGAKSRVQRGREKLKTMLLQCCHVEMDRRGNVVDYQPRHACGVCCQAGTASGQQAGNCQS